MRGRVPPLRRTVQGDGMNSFEESPRYYGYSSAAAERASSFLTAVYMWMCAGLAITAGTAWYIASSPSLGAAVVANRGVFWVLAIAQLGIVFTLSARVEKLARRDGRGPVRHLLSADRRDAVGPASRIHRRVDRDDVRSGGGDVRCHGHLRDGHEAGPRRPRAVPV